MDKPTGKESGKIRLTTLQSLVPEAFMLLVGCVSSVVVYDLIRGSAPGEDVISAGKGWLALVGLVGGVAITCTVLLYLLRASVSGTRLTRANLESEIEHQRKNLEAIFEASPVGLVLVDENTTITKINNVAAKLVGKSPQAMVDVQPGQALGCVHVADDAAGCGNGPLCASCPIRAGIVGVFTSGQPARGLEVPASLAIDGREVRLWLELNAERITLNTRPYVLVSIANITARKRVEERFRVLFESSRDALMILAPPDWRFTSGNPATVAMFAARDEKHFASLAPWDVSPNYQPDGQPSPVKAREMIQAAVREGSHLFEWTHRRLNGEEFPATVLLTRMEIAGQMVVQATVRDITDRKRAEHARQASLDRQARLNRLQQSLLSAGDLDDKLKEVTDAAVEIFDADFCRIWLTHPGDLCEDGCIHADVAEGPHVCRHRDHCLRLATSSGQYTHVDGEVHRRVPFGCYKIGRVASDQDRKFVTNDVTHDPRVHDHEWAAKLGLVSFAGYQLRPPDGETIGVLALFSSHPISQEDDSLLEALGSSVAQLVERCQAEEKLRTAHAELTALFEAIPSILIALRPDGRVARWNPAVERVVGLTADQAVGQLLGECPATWPSQTIVAAAVKCIHSGEQIELDELRFTNAAGSEGFMAMTVNPLSGGEIAAVIHGADITERRILESQLAQSQKLEAIGQLAAGISHEINTPTQFVGDNTQFIAESIEGLLTLIGLYEGLLGSARDGTIAPQVLAEARAYAEEIDVAYLREEIPQALRQSQEGIQRVTKIVRAMKDFSHPNVTEMTPVDLNREIESTATVARNEWKYVAELALDLDRDLPAVECLPGEFNQVILNMLTNAAHAIGKAIGDGMEAKGTITISTRGEGHWVEVRIADTGTGIPDEIRDRIFDPFFTTKEVGRGTGQGLSISRSVIVDKHGGTVSVESEVGKGTTFVIRLPVRANPARCDVDTPRDEDTWSEENAFCLSTTSQG